MQLKLDKIDARLLWELDRNARATLSSLAKKVRLSKEAVRNRIARLEREQVISKYYCIIDVSKLGCYVTKAFVRFQGTTEKEEDEIVAWLTRHSSVVYVERCDGAFDLVFGAWARNVQEYNDFLHSFLNRFNSFISERQIASIVQGQYFVRDYLGGKSAGTEREMLFGAVPSEEKVDDLDLLILAQLGENGRKQFVEIARAVKISPDSVSTRVRKLERAGVIQGYVLLLNHAALGQLHYKVLLRLQNLPDEEEARLLAYCKAHPNIVYAVKAIGPWEYELNIEARGVEEYRSIMREFKREFAGAVKDYSTLNLYKMEKYNFCPSSKP
ncbi:Lrp/AsnC family transcriptional regulator [Candidatus Micrarchaeota archaeon]|nr:Lrp/AsnC family transcriptional regulator [Candidatus Micrarchaeota archaeon]